MLQTDSSSNASPEGLYVLSVVSKAQSDSARQDLEPVLSRLCDTTATVWSVFYNQAELVPADLPELRQYLNKSALTSSSCLPWQNQKMRTMNTKVILKTTGT